MKDIMTLCLILSVCIIGTFFFGCSDRLDITQNYAFDLQVMPYPKRIVQGETVEIRCQIVKEGSFAGAKFSIRYFQPEGKGELRLEDGTLLSPNDLFPLTKEVFRLYYTSRCTDQQTIDVFVEDSFAKVVKRTFDFSNEGEKKEE
jgi:hypothetical protein